MANKNNYQIPSHLIDHLQILLSKESAINPSFTSTHNDDSSHSSLNQAILGSSNPCTDDTIPRCNSCNGDLLRGPQSIICVYCGLPQHLDCVPTPISFNSTVAFRYLLQSLDLDHNQTVGIPVGGPHYGGDRGRGSIKVDEIPLSDYLDLKLNSGDHLNGFGLKKEEQEPKKRYLSLIGVDIDEILSQENVDHGSSIDNVESEEFRALGERNRSLFENVQSYEEDTVKSGEGEIDESFADWGAEFQSPSNSESGGKPFEFKPSGVEISVDSSSNWFPTDEQHKTKNESINKEKNDDDDDDGDDDDDDDDWGDFRMSRTDTITQGEPIDTAGPATDNSDGTRVLDSYNDLSKDIQVEKDNFTVPDDAWNELIVPSSGGDVPLQINGDKDNGIALLDVESARNKISDQSDSVGLWGSSIGDEIPHKESNEGTTKLDNSFDLWNGLSGLGMEKKDQGGSLEVVGSKVNGNKSESFGMWNDNSVDEWSDFTGSKGVAKDDDALGAWNDVSSLMVTHENTPTKYEDQAALAGDNLLSSWSDFGSSGLQIGDTKTSSDQISFQKSSKNDNPVDLWGDFGSATSGLEEQNEASGAEATKMNLSNGGVDFFTGVDNGVKQLTNQHESQVKSMFEGNLMDENDDSFGWGDFTTSSNAEANLKEAGQHGDLLDSLPTVLPDTITVFSNQNGSTHVPFPQSGVSDLVRAEHGDVKNDCFIEGKNTSSKGLESKTSIAETLISEMHDLSFMLESSLSIPKTGT